MIVDILTTQHPLPTVTAAYSADDVHRDIPLLVITLPHAWGFSLGDHSQHHWELTLEAESDQGITTYFYRIPKDGRITLVRLLPHWDQRPPYLPYHVSETYAPAVGVR